MLYDEAITGRAVAGAALVVAGLLAARGAARPRAGDELAERREETPEQVAV